MFCLFRQVIPNKAIKKSFAHLLINVITISTLSFASVDTHLQGCGYRNHQSKWQQITQHITDSRVQIQEKSLHVRYPKNPASKRAYTFPLRTRADTQEPQVYNHTSHRCRQRGVSNLDQRPCRYLGLHSCHYKVY